MMLGRAVLCLTFHFYNVAAQGECTDLRGRLIAHGLHFVPGPDTCTLCVCDNGLPKACKAVLCSPPQDCRSFRVGNTCCEFICLDDVVKPADASESSWRITAGGGAMAVALLTLAIFMYRVRKQMGPRNPHADDQRSITSIGYISGSMGYMGGTCETALASWKPPGNYMPRGEAPPPYDEAMAQCRSELLRMNPDAPFHRTYPAGFEAMARPDDSVPCVGHGYINMPRPVPQMANNQNCYNAPLLQPAHPEPRDQPHHPLVPNSAGSGHVSGSLGAAGGRALLGAAREPARELPPYHSPALHPALHRTIPRISTAIDTTIFDTSILGFTRADRSLQNEIRRSFHKPNENNRVVLVDTGRSMPRNLNLASSSDIRGEEPVRLEYSGGGRSRAHSEEQNVGGMEPKPLKAVGKEVAAPQTLPLTVDKPSCVCSYSGGAPGSEEHDDYRSECENCKSATSSRWVLEQGWRDEAEEGTQTLQRRAPPPAPPPPATATLPQPVTKQRSGPPSNWENWFNTIPDSDTESEEE